MHLFYTVNVSNGGRLQADSGLIFGELLLQGLAERGHSVTTFGSARVPNLKCPHYAYPPLATKYAARFGAPYAELVDALRTSQPTHVFVNQPETVPQVRSALADAHVSARVAAYCHYVPFHVEGMAVVDCASLSDNGLGIAVRLAFLAGLQAADVAFVHSSVAKRWITDAAASHRIPLPTVVIAPPPRDPFFVQATPRAARTPRVVLYNHRLYAHYGADQLLALGSALVSTLGVEIKVMDVLGNRSLARRRLDPYPDELRAAVTSAPGFTLVEPASRDDYRRHLETSLACLAPMRRNCTWSMSCIDAQGLGVPVVAPRYAWFAEHVADDLAFSSADQAVAIVRRLIQEPGYRDRVSEAALRSTEHLEPAAVAQGVEGALLA
ncbi:MAG: glycosyltransferase family 1 protein [Solirubrobacteraceae bacterium]